MKKKILSVLLAFIILLTAIPFAGLTALAATSGDFKYEILSETDKTCEITKYNGNATDLTIPSAIDGYAVTSIGGVAFDGCTSLTNIIMPDSVTSIGNGAFEGCTALASITIPDSVTHISGNVFENTAYYNNPLNWENDVLYIGNHIIKAEDTLSGEYTIRPETKTIADSAFENCKSLTSVTIPDSVITIGWYAFRGCAALEQIIGMKNITRIDGAVFKDTAYYEDLRNWENGVLYIGACLIEANKDFGFKGGYYTVKDNTKTIANRAFYRCDELTELIIPDSVISIGEYAFVGCTDLKSVTLPEFISEIKGRTFLDCVSLKQIEIPKSVVRIYSGAFRNSGLESVIIPESVTEFLVEDGFYPGAFSECDKLKYVELPDTIKEIPYETFYGCDSLSNVVMPVGIEKIGEGAFANCAGLTRVNIPESVTSIAKGAFCNCENLKGLYIPSSVFNLDEQAYGWDIYEIDKTSKKTDVTIYGYLGTEAEQFAKNNDFHFCKLKDVCDDGTAIKFYTKEIENSEECSFSVSTDAQSKNTILYNIQYYVNNILSKPTAPVTVKIPVPASMNGADCKVYRQEADGTYTDMNAFYQNGYMVFTTDHFSVYVITTDDPNEPDVLLGDMDGNGAIDDWDSVLLDRYLAGWDVQVDTSIADIDQNGVVDDWDGVLLSRNLAGWKS